MSKPSQRYWLGRQSEPTELALDSIDTALDDELRDWLNRSLEWAVGSLEIGDDEIDEKLVAPHLEPVSFIGEEAYVSIFFRISEIASDPSDWEVLASQVLSLFERAEWVEEFYASASTFQTTDDARAFTRLSWLFADEAEPSESKDPSGFSREPVDSARAVRGPMMFSIKKCLASKEASRKV